MSIPKVVLAPVTGQTVPLPQVPDAVFSQGMLGWGAAIVPPNQVVTAIAPISGTIAALHPHAYAIADADDFGVLVHLGIDTVKLKGQGFSTLVQVGQAVSAGQAVVEYDVPVIVGNGLDPIVAVVATNEFDAAKIRPGSALAELGSIQAGAVLFTN